MNLNILKYAAYHVPLHRVHTYNRIIVERQYWSREDRLTIRHSSSNEGILESRTSRAIKERCCIGGGDDYIISSTSRRASRRFFSAGMQPNRFATIVTGNACWSKPTSREWPVRRTLRDGRCNYCGTSGYCTYVHSARKMTIEWTIGGEWWRRIHSGMKTEKNGAYIKREEILTVYRRSSSVHHGY